MDDKQNAQLDLISKKAANLNKSKKKEAAKAVKQIQRDARMLLVCKTRLRKNAHDLKRQLKCIKDDPKISDGVKADLTKFAATLQQSQMKRWMRTRCRLTGSTLTPSKRGDQRRP